MKTMWLAMVLVVLPGCASKPQPKSGFCTHAKVIPWNPGLSAAIYSAIEAKKLSESEAVPTILGVVRHNKVGQNLCGWQP